MSTLTVWMISCLVAMGATLFGVYFGRSSADSQSDGFPVQSFMFTWLFFTLEIVGIWFLVRWIM